MHLKIYFLLLFCIYGKLSAQDTIDLSSLKQGELTIKQVKIYEDKTRFLSYYDVLKKISEFKTTKEFNLGYSNSAHWINFKLKNSTSKDFNGVLKIQKPLHDSLQIYYKINNKLISHSAGIEVPWKGKKYSGFSNYLPLKLNKGKTINVYLRNVSKYGKSLNMTIAKKYTFHRDKFDEISLVFFLIGALLAISLYSFFLSYAIKDRTYLIYGFGILGSVLVQLTIRGFVTTYFFGKYQSILLRTYAPSFFLVIGAILITYYCRVFLNLKKYHPLSDKILKFFSLFLITTPFILIVSKIFNIYITNILISLAYFFLGFLLLYAGIKAHQTGNRYGKYYIIAWSICCITIIIYTSALFSFLPSNFFTNNAYLIGSFLEVILLSLALGERYKVLQEDKEKMFLEIIDKNKQLTSKKQEVIQLLSESVERLQEKVKLTRNLKKVVKSDQTNISLNTIISELQSEKIDDKKLLYLRENITLISHSFVSRLKQNYPNLTKTDIEMASFARLELSRKEMAALRNCSLEAIKKNRYRLKKKLNLPTNLSINDFIKLF